MAANKGILETIGLEIESSEVCPHTIESRINRSVWRIDHDASVESDVRLETGGFVIRGSTNQELPMLSGQRVTQGVELVLQPPYSMENGRDAELLSYISEMTYLLSELGDSPKSQRAGIHVHICMPMNLNLLKAYLILGAHMEDVFYRFGSNGYQFRGMSANNSAYCRPITKWGPPCVPVGNSRFAQVFTIPRLLAAKTTAEFWWAYGNINVDSGVGRYHPARYTWLNLYSLLAHGTLEFRLFNCTHNPWLIWSEIMFCQAFCRYAIKLVSGEESLDRFVEHSVYDNRSIDGIEATYLEFCELAKIPDSIKNVILDSLHSSPPVVIEPGYMKTHLRNDVGSRGYDFASCKETTYLKSSEVAQITVTDIHTLRGER